MRKNVLLFLFLLLGIHLLGETKGKVISYATLCDKIDDTFADDLALNAAVKKVYGSVLKSDWLAIYPFLKQSYRDIYDEETFVATLNRDMSRYPLVNIDFLNVENRRNEGVGITQCRVVQKVFQGMSIEAYYVVTWAKVGDSWYCDSIGLYGSPLVGSIIPRE